MADEAKKVSADPQGIRSYGPGKFDTIVDSYVYSVSLDGGADEELGDVSETGRWYGLMRGQGLLEAVEKQAAEEKDQLTQDEKDLFKEEGGVILSEDDQGFVTVDYFDTKEALEQKWTEIENDTYSDDDIDEISKEIDSLAETLASLSGEPMCEAKKYRRAKRNRRRRILKRIKGKK
jgi:hypothetical protein